MEPLSENHSLQGVVYKKTIGHYEVRSDGRVTVCAVSSRLRKRLGMLEIDPEIAHGASRAIITNRHVDPIAIGDEVRFVEAPDARGLIVEVLPRRNRFARQTAVPMPGAHAFEQVIAANVDQVIPVFAAANPAPKWNMLDRYLVSAESAGLPALICISKADLVHVEKNSHDQELWSELDNYRKIGYPFIIVSAYTGAGLDELKQALQGRVSVLLGKSGVGKTSLLNAIQPGLGLRVNEVNRVTGKGKHTTTSSEMVPIDAGGAIVDTPGVREFGLWDIDDADLALLFPEIRPFVGQCRFGLDCRHDEEPGCAVRKAVMAGHISPRRYQSYAKLKEDP